MFHLFRQFDDVHRSLDIDLCSITERFIEAHRRRAVNDNVNVFYQFLAIFARNPQIG